MHEWEQSDPGNVQLKKIGRKWKSYDVNKFVHDLAEAKIWRGKELPREYSAGRKSNRKGSVSPRKRSPRFHRHLRL